MKNYFILFIFTFAGLTLSAQHLDYQKFFKKTSAFVQNKGQIADQHGNLRPDVLYLYNGSGFKVQFKQNSISYELYTIQDISTSENESLSENESNSLNSPFRNFKPNEVHTSRIDVSFPGSSTQCEWIAEEVNSDFTNYFLGHTPENGITEVLSFQKLICKNLYPNIDLVYYARENGQFKYDIVVHPGGNLNSFAMKYLGASPKIKNNCLSLITPQGNLSETIPHSYLIENNTSVSIKYSIKNGTIYFNGNNQNKTLIIDPILTWGTYYGGTNSEYGFDVTTDSTGFIYITGFTSSPNGIATQGAYQSIDAGNRDVFIAKFDNRDSIQWGTYYGGYYSEISYSICTDNQGHIFITGETNSTDGIATSNAYDTIGSSNEAFLACFTTDGSRVWATYFGGSSSDYGNGITADGIASVYLVGRTFSDFLASKGSYQTSNFGNDDGFIARFDSVGNFKWASYYGGYYEDAITSAVSDKLGNIFITGYSYSDNQITSNSSSKQPIYRGNRDAFLSRFDSTGNLIWGNYFGGKSLDASFDICMDNQENLYITGITYSSNNINTLGTSNSSLSGINSDSYIAKFDTSGSQLWGTYFGGNLIDAGNSITVDDSGFIFITGHTKSDSNVVTQGAIQNKLAGDYDIFISRHNSNGNLNWATYMGSVYADKGLGICSDHYGNIYSTGLTFGNTGIATPGTHKSSTTTQIDAYITRFNFDFVAFAGIEDTICSGINYFIGDSAKSGHFYSWNSTPSGFSDSSSMPFVNPKTTTKYYLKDSAFGFSRFDSVIITVIPAPYSRIGVSKSICKGDSLVIGDSSIAGYTYSWTSLPIGLYSIQSSETVNPIGTTTYFLTTTNDTTGCSITDSVIISILPYPKAQVGTNISICPNDTITIGSTAVIGNTYTWISNPSGFTSNSANPNVWPTYSTKYILYETDGKTGCSNSDSIVISMNPVPSKPIITQQGNQLISSASDGNTWFKNGIQTSYSGSTISPATSGKFTIRVKNIDGCTNVSDTFYFVHSNPSSIEYPEITSINVFPIPFHDGFNIESNPTISFEILDLTGRKMVQGKTDQNNIFVNSQNWAAGIYILKWPLGNIKIVKQ